MVGKLYIYMELRLYIMWLVEYIEIYIYFDIFNYCIHYDLFSIRVQSCLFLKYIFMLVYIF